MPLNHFIIAPFEEETPFQLETRQQLFFFVFFLFGSSADVKFVNLLHKAKNWTTYRSLGKRAENEAKYMNKTNY